MRLTTVSTLIFKFKQYKNANFAKYITGKLDLFLFRVNSTQSCESWYNPVNPVSGEGFLAGIKMKAH